MPDLHNLPAGTWPSAAYRNNGPDNLAFERFKLRELAEGWPMYRDSSEWENFASIFAENAYVYTSWTGRIDIKVTPSPESHFSLFEAAFERVTCRFRRTLRQEQHR